MRKSTNYKDYQSFHKLKKALNLRVDLDIGQRWGATYCRQEDMSFLVKRYEGKGAKEFLKTFVQNYENAVQAMADEAINEHIEIVPFLHVGDDFIIKPWILYMTPYGEIREAGLMRDAYLKLTALIETKTKNQDLKNALLRSAKKQTTYLDYRHNKLVFVDLDFE